MHKSIQITYFLHAILRCPYWPIMALICIYLSAIWMHNEVKIFFYQQNYYKWSETLINALHKFSILLVKYLIWHIRSYLPSSKFHSFYVRHVNFVTLLSLKKLLVTVSKIVACVGTRQENWKMKRKLFWTLLTSLDDVE